MERAEQSKERADVELRIQHARTDAEHAVKDTAEAKTELARQRERTAEAESKLEVLRVQSLPRAVTRATPELREELRKSLSKTPDLIGVWALEPTFEVRIFAKFFVADLSIAGWSVEDHTFDASPPPGPSVSATGIFIVTSTPESPAVQNLQEALKAAKVGYVGILEAPEGAPAIRLYVGSK